MKDDKTSNATNDVLPPHETTIVAAIDNNQKGHELTFQKFGSSNKFVKVAARFVRKTVNFNVDIGECTIDLPFHTISNPFHPHAACHLVKH